MEHFYGDWEIINSSDKYEKTDAFTAEFRVSVPPNGTKILTYTVENRIAVPTPIGTTTSTTADISTSASMPASSGAGVQGKTSSAFILSNSKND